MSATPTSQSAQIAPDGATARAVLPAVRKARLHPLGRLAPILLIVLAACASPPPTDLMLPGGIPARTDLHAASTLPPGAARSVARKDAGWRVIYHPAQAPPGADQRAAAALCRLERKRAVEINVQPMQAPQDDPGARMIDIICG